MKFNIHYFIFYCFLLSVFSSFNSSAQGKKELDSLLKILPFDKNDTNKVRHLIFISEDYSNFDVKKSLEYAEKALKTSNDINWQRGIGSSCFRIAFAYSAMGNFSAALEYRLKVLQKWEQIKYTTGICGALADIGVSYSDLGNNAKAMEYYIKSLQLAEKNGEHERIITNLCNIASINYLMGNEVKAIENYNHSLELARKYKFRVHEATNLANLGNLYQEKKQFNFAMKFHTNALNIFNETDNKVNATASLINIAGLYQLLGDSARSASNQRLSKKFNLKALDYFQKALILSKELGNAYYIANILGNTGAIQITENRYTDAEANLLQALHLADSVKSLEEISIAYQRLFALYKKKNNLQKALIYFEKYAETRDSLFNSQNSRTISELQAKYETDKKEKENQFLKQQNMLQSLSISNHRYFLLSLSGVFVLMVCFGFLIYRQSRMKSLQRAALLEQKLLRTQMNPHFIFNSLASIESFIYDHQPKEAGMYLSGFSRLMRLILENSASELISLEKEVEILGYYLSLEKLRLNGNLDYCLEIDPQIDPAVTYLPPMLTQPFIENAIEHGFRGKMERGIVKIEFHKNKNQLSVSVTDNGMGLAEAGQQKDMNKTRKSMAINITQERLMLLNKSKKQKIYFDVSDIENENKQCSGTKVSFSIPV